MAIVYGMKAQNLSGIYSVNKGVNKEQASIYLHHYKPDTAFLYLTYLSGAPDFEPYCMKGFIHVSENSGRYADSSNRVHFFFTRSSLSMVADTPCKLKSCILTKFRKTTSIPNRNRTMYIDFTEHNAQSKTDTLLVYEVPDVQSKVLYTLNKTDEIKVVDSYGAFYLIETPDNGKEFLWVQKKYLNVKKN